jgi:single-strand DNA-binding protein
MELAPVYDLSAVNQRHFRHFQFLVQRDTQASWGVPFHRFPPVAEGVGRDGTPVGQACTADRQTKETEPKTLFNKVILIGRFGQNAEATTAQNKEYVVLNIATQESWKNDKGDYENRTEWHRAYAWRNLSKFSKTLQKGQLVTLEGILRYREVEDEIEGHHVQASDR